MKTIKLEKIQHPIFTSKLVCENNIVSFDIRPAKDYLNRFNLLFRISKPDILINNGATNILSSESQNNLTFNSRKQAREYIYNEIINYL